MNFKLSLILFLAIVGRALAATDAKVDDIEADIDALDDSIELIIKNSTGAAKAAAERCHDGIGDLQATPHECQGMKDTDTKCPSQKCHERLSVLTAHCTAELMGPNIVAHLKVCDIDPANPDIELDMDKLNVDMEYKLNDTTLDATTRKAVERCHQGLDELEALPHDCEEFKDSDTKCPSEKCHERLSILNAHCSVELLGPNIVSHLKICNIDPANPDLESDLDSLNVDMEIKLQDKTLDATTKAAVEKCHKKLDELETQTHSCEDFTDASTTCPAGCKQRLESLTQGCTADLYGENVGKHIKICAASIASAAFVKKVAGAFIAAIAAAMAL